MSATPEQIAERLEQSTDDTVNANLAAAALIRAQSEREKVLVDLLRDALGMASQHRVAALDAEHGARGDRTRPASDADWHAFQDRIRAALAGAR